MREQMPALLLAEAPALLSILLRRKILNCLASNSRTVALCLYNMYTEYNRSFIMSSCDCSSVLQMLSALFRMMPHCPLLLIP